MKTVTGIDIVSIERMVSLLDGGGTAFAAKCFHEVELEDSRTEHLAGLFAAKEAVLKALSMKAGSWKDIRIFKDEMGRPCVDLVSQHPDVASCEVSISHDAGFAVAVCVAVLS